MLKNSLDIERVNNIFEGEFSEEGMLYFRMLFSTTSNESDLEAIAKKQWSKILRQKFPEDKPLEHILYKIHYEINTDSNKQEKNFRFKDFVIWSSRVAAILLLPLLVCVWLFFSDLKKGEPVWVEINAPSWSRVQFGLPDGSTGWLNSNSSLKYQGDFINDRKVVLEGEAYFDVKSDPEKPFEVRTNEIMVIATGTKFNIASYKDDKAVEVVMEEGVVEVKDLAMTKLFVMSADDLVIYDKITGELSSQKVQSEKYYAWTEGKLIFRNDPVDVIAHRLGRWYNVDIEVDVDNFSDVRLRATFVDENLEDVLYFLKKALSIDFKIIDRGITNNDGVYSRKKILFTARN